MADAKQIEFGKRLQRIDRSHRQLDHGYVAAVGDDGLIVAKPVSKSSNLPLRGLFLSLVVLLMFKAFVYAQIGALAYEDRVGLLESGTFVEKIGAFVMKADPVTIWIAEQIALAF